MKEIKDKKCKWCGSLFKPFRTTQINCSPVCALNFVRDKAIDKKVKTMREGLKTHSDYLKILQIVFNSYIRLRDKDQPCISCGTISSQIKYDAGHFYSVGAYPNLRFNELNVHKQCSNNCNLNKHGNFAEYNMKLPERIGLDAYQKLMNERNIPLKLSIPEIQELIKIYKLKLKTLQNETE